MQGIHCQCQGPDERGSVCGAQDDCRESSRFHCQCVFTSINESPGAAHGLRLVKGRLDMMTKIMALELGKHNVRQV